MTAATESPGPQPLDAARRWRWLFAGLILQVLLGAWHCAEAADVRVFCPNALRESALELARSYARISGNRVEFVFASVGTIHKRVAMNERADVVIGTAEGIDALVRLGAAQPDAQAQIARTSLALVGREATALPSPDSAEDVERALKAAVSLGVPDAQRGIPGATQALELIELLASSAELRTKIRWLGSGAEAIKLLASRSIDLALVSMSDVAAFPGINLAGPITSPRTRGVMYAAAVPRSAQQPELGRAFIAHLRTSAAAKILREAGYLAVE